MLTLPTILKKSNEETNLRIYTKDCNSTSNQRFDTSLALYATGRKSGKLHAKKIPECHCTNTVLKTQNIR